MALLSRDGVAFSPLFSIHLSTQQEGNGGIKKQATLTAKSKVPFCCDVAAKTLSQDGQQDLPELSTSWPCHFSHVFVDKARLPYFCNNLQVFVFCA